MNHNIRPQYSDDGLISSHFQLNALQYDTSPSVPAMYSVPPPNMYVSPYLHYSNNCVPNFAASQHTNVLVPPYPPPDFQNISYPASNYTPRSRNPSFGKLPHPYSFDMQGNNNLQEAFVITSSSGELEKQNLHNEEVSGDALWIEKWLEKKEGRKLEVMITERPVKISEAKESFKKCINLLEQLEKLKSQMEAGGKHMSDAIWSSLCQDFTYRKNKVSDCILNLPDIQKLKRAVIKRCKKRECQNRRNKKKKEIKMINNENRQVLHHKIDTWQKIMQETIDKNKREESLKKEADSVLSEVLRKKADVRRHLGLVASLLQLRKLRLKTATNRGQHIVTDDGIRFEKVVENLKALWEKQLVEYNIEEQGMRVMLSEAVDERDQSQVSQERNIMSQWGKLLFGTKPCDFSEFYLAAEKNIESFVNIRHCWDKFIVSDRASVQSNMPVGWILPSNPSSPNWEALLSHNNI